MIVMVTALLRVVVHSAMEVRYRPLLLQGRRKSEGFQGVLSVDWAE